MKTTYNGSFCSELKFMYDKSFGGGTISSQASNLFITDNFRILRKLWAFAMPPAMMSKQYNQLAHIQTQSQFSFFFEGVEVFF